MAIIARWRMPPLNWNGKSRARCLGEGMRTRSRRGMTRALACRLSNLEWARIASSIWKPTRRTGFREVMGSWKIMATSPPRYSSSSPEVIVTTSRFLNKIWPPEILPGSGTRLRIESAVIDLPLPDSPTMPSVSPASISKLTPSTARTVPDSPGRGAELCREVLDLE